MQYQTRSQLIVPLCVALLLGACSGSATKAPAPIARPTLIATDQKLIGKWVLVNRTFETDFHNIDFLAGGELKVTLKRGNETRQRDGTYGNEGSRLSIILELPELGRDVLITHNYHFSADNQLVLDEIDAQGAVTGRLTFSRDK